MTFRGKNRARGRQRPFLLFVSLILVSSSLVGCGPSAADLAAVDYAPLQRDDWEVSTPEAQGLDPDLVAELHYDAARLNTIYSLLIVKNGYLVAEKYFNEGSIALLDELDMVIVVTGNPFRGEHSANAWKYEKQLKNLAANSVASLPSE
jgi:hypothetical protein